VAQLILDTSVLVAADRAGGAVEKAIGDTDDLAIAAVTVAELELGVLLGPAGRRRARRAYVDAVLDTVHVIPYDRSVALRHAELMAHVRSEGRPKGAHDLIIAATALAGGRRLVSHDRRGYADLPGLDVVIV
jgi:predicted nucleic acid-binding protein